jgi:hypothetical protein
MKRVLPIITLLTWVVISTVCCRSAQAAEPIKIPEPKALRMKGEPNPKPAAPPAATAQAEKCKMPSWMEAVTVAPVGAMRHLNAPNGDVRYGAGLEVGVPVNPFISINFINLAYSEEPSASISRDTKHGRVVRGVDDGWGGSAIDHTLLQAKGRLCRVCEPFNLYGKAGGSRDWVNDDWGLNAGLGLEYSFSKRISAGAESVLELWDKQKRDVLTLIKLQYKF